MTALPLDYSTNFEAVETLSDLNSNYTTEPPLFDSAVRQIASALNVYYTPILILLGSIGNLVSVFVFYRSKLRLQSTSQYLSALAVSDTIFLLQLLPPWLNAVHITGLFHQEGFCQIFIYISYVTCSFSAWLVVAFTIERFVAVIYPLHRNMVCSVKRARYVIGGIALGSLLLNIPVLRFAIPTPDDCNIDYEYLAHAARFNMVDTVVSFTVPLAVIIVLNIWIMVGVWRIERARGELMRTDHLAVLGSHALLARQVGCPRSQQRVTRMLLIVSSVFVCLNLPAYTMRVIAYAYGMNQDEYNGRWEALQQVTLMFFYTNFGINFILYCLSGQNFRQALKVNLSRFRRYARYSITIRRRTFSHPARTGSVSTSFISNCTDATSNCGASTPNPRRRRRSEQYISRWTFDNSRQHRIQSNGRVNIEMVDRRPVSAPPPGAIRRYRSVEPPPRSMYHNF